MSYRIREVRQKRREVVSERFIGRAQSSRARRSLGVHDRRKLMKIRLAVKIGIGMVR